MANWEIESPVAGAVWLIAGGWLSYRFRNRVLDANEILGGRTVPKPSEEEANRLRARLVAEAFVSGGALLALYFLLGWLF